MTLSPGCLSCLFFHHLLVFQSWVTLTSSTLSKKHISGPCIATHSGAWTLPFVWHTLLLLNSNPLLHCSSQLGFSSSVFFYSLQPSTLSKVTSDALVAPAFFFFLRGHYKFTEIKITIWMMYCANPFKSLQKHRKKSIRIAMATTNTFICKNEIK